uniref:Partial AB-hydrolase lipase domain-containing protein n=1 Tax=Aegilops tauschii subsp. strangulata TaxID=200361 RepID=A0A453KFX6_AEGTS
MAVPGGGAAAALALTLLLLLRSCVSGATHASSALRHAVPRGDAGGGLCGQLLLPLGYPCTEHTVETDDGFLLSLQHIPHGKNGVADNTGPPVFLQHGLFQV